MLTLSTRDHLCLEFAGLLNRARPLDIREEYPILILVLSVCLADIQHPNDRATSLFAVHFTVYLYDRRNTIMLLLQLHVTSLFFHLFSVSLLFYAPFYTQETYNKG